tara:strand:- start:2516 stop:3481 length:966 start_codon:yes stop_codon:yes gene_type:complete
MTITPENPESRVAICICTHSRAQELKQVLSSLRNIDLGTWSAGDVELLVIDNSPSSTTRDICEDIGATLPIELHYSTEPKPGITYARNRAVALALERGARFIAFIDDDDIPRSDWLLQLLERQQETHADIVFGSWIMDEQMPQWAEGAGIFRPPNKVKRKTKDSRYGLPSCASTCNVLVGRDILERVGAQGPIFSHAFCNSGGEDKDFFIRARNVGALLTSADDSLIHRNHDVTRYSARGLLRRGFKNGCSQVNMARTHGSNNRMFKMFSSAFAKLLLSLISLPFLIFSKSKTMHNLYRMAKSGGVLYTTLTGRSIKYYAG